MLNINKYKIDSGSSRFSEPRETDERGFTLIEAIIAMVILTVCMLSVVTVFTYALRNNTGNNTRSQALAVLQREVERLRAAKFIPSTNGTDELLKGGTKAVRNENGADGSTYQVQIVVDNYPFNDGVPGNDESTTTLKEITVIVTPLNVSSSWVTAVQARSVFRRVRGN
ncbi:MAG: prepilin-type N-terminal cleavage/methylation domain-containing protein [Acidobacteriota bacterium]|nr:prepilin-type N-terminal cleavage/methylation domain-containing protein [Acidobacteriota bacterium]